MKVLGLRVGLPETSGDLRFWTSDVTVAFRLTLERTSLLLVGFVMVLWGGGDCSDWLLESLLRVDFNLGQAYRILAITAIFRSGRQNSDTERGRFLYGVTWRPWRLFAVVAKYLG